jgi:four helix bundle protein
VVKKGERMTKYKTYRFREFPVYKDSLVFISKVKSYTRKKFPREEQFGLSSQLWRALNSIVLNIAEGTDRYSGKDFSRFLNNAIGSLNEVVACLDLALLDGYVSRKKHEEFLDLADNLYRQLKAFSSTVRKRT